MNADSPLVISDAGCPPRPIRVALIHYRDDAIAGGSLRVGETLANHFDPSKVEAHLVFAYGGPGPVASCARVPCHFLRSTGPTDLRGWFRARSLIRKLQPDILHFQDGVFWMQCALCGTAPKRLLHVHGKVLPDHVSLIDKFLNYGAGLGVDGHICISDGARDAQLALGWASPEKSWTVYNSIPYESFQALPSRCKARQEFGIPQDAIVLGMLCRLVRHKGCGEAILLLHKLRKTFHLMVCGDGPARTELEALAAQEGLLDRVHFTGLLSDVRPAYAAMDAYLMLSRHEPFGLVMAEAMASGVPVFGLIGEGEYLEARYPLITPFNACFIERRERNYHLREEDPAVLEELARRISVLADRPDVYRPMIETARRWIRERFDCRIQCEATAAVYREIQGALAGDRR